MPAGVLAIPGPKPGVAPSPKPGLDWGKPKTVGFAFNEATKDTKVSTHAGVFRSNFYRCFHRDHLLLYASAWSIFYFPGLPTQTIKERHGEQGREGS